MARRTQATLLRRLFFPVLPVAALLLAGCGGGDSATTGTSATTTTTESTTTTAESSSTTSATTTESSSTTGESQGEDETLRSGPASEAEPGLRFDYGAVTGFETVDARTWISFDRWSFGIDKQQGVQLLEEPRYELATDWHGGMNDNDRIRMYPLGPDVSILLLTQEAFDVACGAVEGPVPDFVEADLNELLASAGDSRGAIVSLTFAPNGDVILIRDQRGC